MPAELNARTQCMENQNECGIRVSTCVNSVSDVLASCGSNIHNGSDANRLNEPVGPNNLQWHHSIINDVN
jgi:hypothetical protein